MDEVSICLRDYTVDPSLLTGWMEQFSTSNKNQMKIDDESFEITDFIRREAQNRSIPSRLHANFLETFLTIIPKEDTSAKERQLQYNTVFNSSSGEVAQDGNDPIESWVTELVQNAIDLKATKIRLEINQDNLVFYHNGRSGGDLFKLYELTSLYSVNASTKVGDFSKIGKFGIGFKYWWRHFETLEVKCVEQVDGSSEQLTIQIDRYFQPKNSHLKFQRSETDDSGTYFTFSSPMESAEWVNRFSFDEDNKSVIAERLYQSLPFVQLKVRDRFSMSVSIFGQESEYYCDVESEMTSDNCSIEKIRYGRNGLITEEQKLWRISTDINLFRTSMPNKYNSFRDLVISEYKKSETFSRKLTDETLTEIADKALETTVLANLYTPSEEHGMLSNLFVANHPNSFISSPMIAEAPWKLERDRVRIDMTRGGEWNRILARFVDELHSEFLKVVISDATNLDYSDSELCDIINTPIGESHNFNVENGVYLKAFEGDCLPLETYPNRLIDRTKAKSHASDTLDLDENLFFAQQEIQHLWHELESDEDRHAFEWLQEGFHPSLATLKLKSGTSIPLTFTDKNHEILPESHKPISNRCGEGIPDKIHNLLSPNQEMAADSDDQILGDESSYPFRNEQMQFFEDVVHSRENQLYFRTEHNLKVVDVSEIQQEDFDLLLEGTECLELCTGDAPKLLFYNPEHNIFGHKSVNELITFEMGIENILLQAYDNSELIEESGGQEMKEWIASLQERRWHNTALLAEETRQSEMPSLVGLPKPKHALTVILGLEGKREIHSINIEKFSNSGVVVFGNTPFFRRWNASSDGIVFCRPRNTFEWIEENSPFDDEGKRRLNWDAQKWDWSDLTPDGTDGWTWPSVRLSTIQNEEERSEIARSMNPIFIDAFHEISETGAVGVHRGYRTMDNENLPRVKKQQLNHYGNGTEQTKLNHMKFLGDNLKSFPLIKNSIHLHPDIGFNSHRTKQEQNKVILDHEVIKPHGLIRVYGWQIYQAELNSWDFENEEFDGIDFLQLQTENYTAKSMTDSCKNKIEVFDIILCRGGTRTANPINSIGLFAANLHYGPEKSEYFSDNDEPRARNEHSFSELRENGVYGFSAVSDNWFRDSKSFCRLFRDKIWLPVSAELYTQYTELGWVETESIQFVPIESRETLSGILGYRGRTDDYTRVGIDPADDRWQFRFGLTWLFCKLENSELEDSLSQFCLKWLNEAVECNLPRTEWLDHGPEKFVSPGNQFQITRTPRQILNKFKENITTFNYVKELLDERDVVGDWTKFVTRCKVTSDNQNRIGPLQTEHDKMIMPILDVRETLQDYSTTFESSITLNKFRLHLEKQRIVVGGMKNATRRILRFKGHTEDNPIFVVENEAVLNVLKRMIGERTAINEVLLHHSLEAPTTTPDSGEALEYAPVEFNYLEALFSNFFKDVHWIKQEEELDTSHHVAPGVNGLLIKINAEQESIQIYVNEPQYLSTGEYDVLSKWVIELCRKKLDSDSFDDDLIQWVSDNANTMPLPNFLRTLPGLGHRPNLIQEDILFKEEYCMVELDFNDLDALMSNTLDVDQLEDTMKALITKYQTNDPSLKHSSHKLKQWYESMPAVTMGRHNSWTGVFDPQSSFSVDSHVSVGWWMLPNVLPDRRQVSDVVESTAGGTLAVNVQEASWYKRYACDDDSKEGYDFTSDCPEKIRDTLLQNWTSDNEFIIAEGILKCQTGEAYPMLLHKHHAVHIYAYLRARIEELV